LQGTKIQKDKVGTRMNHLIICQDSEHIADAPIVEQVNSKTSTNKTLTLDNFCMQYPKKTFFGEL